MVQAAVTLYLRDGKLYATPVSGAEGLFFEQGEVLVLEPVPQVLAEALPRLFAQSVFPAEPPDLHLLKSGVHARAGFASPHEFARGAVRVDVRRRAEEISLSRMTYLKGDWRGRVVDRRPVDTSSVELAEWILGWLAGDARGKP